MWHFVVVMVELVGVPWPNSEAGHRVGGPKTMLNFCCTCLKMQSNAELKRLDVDSPLLIENMQVSKLLRGSTEVTELMGRLTHP